jgi:recombinational DNA repair ATPase RecF
MTSALHDFQKFVNWLYAPMQRTPEDVRRFANIVLMNFATVAASSRQHSQRSAVLVDLACQLLPTADPQPLAPTPAIVRGPWAWRSLKYLTVGPFRGFRNPETFDLQKRIILFSGPNGSGKTSLCEALEFALLGTVDEGEIKRITASNYLSNFHERRFTTPDLIASDHMNQPIRVIADADAYRFCFVEKNRIDSFSRIAAKPAGQKTELIAALFGIDRFNEFVGHFNDSMDSQLILQGLKQRELANKRASLTQDFAMVANEQATLQSLTQTEINYAASLRAGLSYAGLLTELGTDQVPGRLQELEQEINKPTPYIYEISSKSLADAYNAADTAQKTMDDIAGQLINRSTQVSYKDLYTAVLGLQQVAGDHCPACDTPLQGMHRALRDPYEKAATGLLALKELGEIQSLYNIAFANRNRTSIELSGQLRTFAQRVNATVENSNAVVRYLANPQFDQQRAWWRDGFQPDSSGKSLAQHAIDWAANLETADAQAQQALANRQQLIQERDRLNQARIHIATLAAARQQAIDAIASAKARVAAFDVANSALIQEAAREIEDIRRDTRIKTAYDQFLAYLRRYKLELPGTLMEGLNVLAMELYNEFNRNDFDADKLAALYLPVTGEGRIEIAFRGAPTTRVDALHILSEGHVRCLGLAILLAKGLSIQTPVIIFDDAVNAIDHEHREGIRETIFQSQRFSSTQIIVTCHSNEFVKDIQNHVPVDQWAAYAFKNHNGDYHPRVQGNSTSQNYLVNARTSVDQGNDRAALGFSRQALEMLSIKIWKWLERCDQGMLTLKIAGAGTEPALRTLCESLRAKLQVATTFTHDEKDAVIEALNIMLGIPEQSLVWYYLNKGIHEEANRDDFDSKVVESVVRTLESLNTLKLRTK